MRGKKKKSEEKSESSRILKERVVIDKLCPHCSYDKQLNAQ